MRTLPPVKLRKEFTIPSELLSLIGQSMATTLVSLLMAKLVRHFKFRLCES